MTKFLNDVDENNWQYPYNLVYAMLVNGNLTIKQIGLYAEDDNRANEMADYWTELMEAKILILEKEGQEE